MKDGIELPSIEPSSTNTLAPTPGVPNPQPPLVLTVDIGTSSTRCMLFDAQAHPVENAEIQVAYEMRTTADGGVETDADEMFDHACSGIDQILRLAGPRAALIAGVGSDSLVGNILGVSAEGKAMTPVYTYADTRGAREVADLRARFDERAAHQRLGTLFHTSYLPARFLWLAHAHPELMQRARWWMSLGEYFMFRWFGRRACTLSVASWTGLLNRQSLEWDADLLAALPISREQLSPLVDFDTPFNGLVPEFAARWPALDHATWFPTVGDGAAANIGSGCVNASRIALTIGTSSAMRVTLPDLSGDSRPGRREVPWGLWSYRVDKRAELVGGALSEGGNLFHWVEETLALGDRARVEAELAALPPDGHGLTVLPFLAGERSPGWKPDARASILGLSLNTRPIEILRAGLEAIAYRLDLVFELLRRVAPEAHEVIASGGALMHSPIWIQIIADVLGVPVIASAEKEATSRGIALLVLRALDVITTLESLPAKLDDSFMPNPAHHEIYGEAVKRQQKWYNLLVEGPSAT